MLFVIAPLSAEPSSTPRDATWVTNGQVSAIASDGASIYIGGDFTYVGPNTGSGVPIDTATGSPVATYPRVDATVSISVPDGSGGWYIGGYFSFVGATARNRIAHILSDGTVDSSWNPNANGTVYTLPVGAPVAMNSEL